MNGFFPKWRIIVFSVLTSLMVAALLVRYARLSAAQPERVAQKVPAVERGSIVDRNGKPLAVDTNFFHMGINPQKIKNPEDFARDVAPALIFFFISLIFFQLSKKDPVILTIFPPAFHR